MDALMWTLAGTALVSLISFVGVVGLSLRDRALKEMLLVFVALSAGVLIGDAFFHLIPDALAGFALGGADTLFAYVLAGFVVFFLLEKVVHWRHCHDVGCKVHTFGYMNLAGDAVGVDLDACLPIKRGGRQNQQCECESSCEFHESLRFTMSVSRRK